MDPKLLQQEYNALAPIYNPEVQLVEQQLKALPGQATAQKSALEQAKVNAFRDITSQARGRGVYFSGFRPENEARYVGEKFLPALAGIEADVAANQTALQRALIDINQRRQGQAQSQAQAILDRREQQRQFDMQLQAEREAAARQVANTTPKAPTKNELYASVGEDVRQLFQGYDRNSSKSRGYTEKAVLPQLTNLYPELSPTEISKLVYSYRRNVFGE